MNYCYERCPEEYLVGRLSLSQRVVYWRFHRVGLKVANLTTPTVT